MDARLKDNVLYPVFPILYVSGYSHMSVLLFLQFERFKGSGFKGSKVLGSNLGRPSQPGT
jgi:hypothetical protein